MRKRVPQRLEAGRVRQGAYASDPSYGCYGAFMIMGPCGDELVIIAGGADDDDKISRSWEHVSVSLKDRTPTWEEMSFVKDLFWHETETVIQFHPHKSEYVNCHPNCLHLWRHKSGHTLPPSYFVGPK